MRRVGQAAASAGLGLVIAFTTIATASGQAATDATAAASAAGHGRILLVLPFDNQSGQPSLEWIREAAPQILSSRFASAGFAPMSRQDRNYALDHLGLPQGFHPSRASSLKLAETLDADSIVVGSFVTDGTAIVAQAQIVDVPHLRMTEAVSARGEMRDVLAVFDTLAWKLTRQLDPGFSVAQETFVAASAGIRVNAFEQYIRGITEPDQQERLSHLKRAVEESPDFGPAWMALGREDYKGQQYEQAAAAFAKVGRNDPDALEAGFYRGLSLVFSGGYVQAEEAFGGVARILPLAEVVNNQGVAASRQGHDGVAFFRQAVAADPNSADYHFNLAVSLHRQKMVPEALTELATCLRLRPYDTEAQALETDWKVPAATPAPRQDSASSAEAKADPLERISRNFDAAAFHQAAMMLDQVDASRLAALTPSERAQKLATQARSYLESGLLLEAERLYLTAVADDNKVAEAHAGLAEVRERTGDETAARKEAVASLELLPSANAYLVLGRLDLSGGDLDQAGKDVDEALKLAPADKAAEKLRKQIEAKRVEKK